METQFLHFVRFLEEDNLQLEWDNCVSWSSMNKLPLNYFKCKVLNIITKTDYANNRIATSDVFLQNVDDLKVLGVTLSSSLTWNSNIRRVVSKASQRICIIRNLKRCDCPTDLMVKAYMAFVRSVLLYAYLSFCNLHACLFEKLNKVEKKKQ